MDRRVVEMVHDPDAPERNHASQHDAGQCVHENAEQARKRAQDPLTGLKQLLGGLVQCPDDARQYQYQQELLPQGPLLPWDGQ